MSQVPSDGVILSHRTESAFFTGTCRPSRPPSSSYSGFLLVLENPGLVAVLTRAAASAQNCSLWSRLSPASLVLVIQVSAQKAPQSLPRTPCLQRTLSCHLPSSAFPWIIRFTYSEVGSDPHCLDSLSGFAPLLLCGPLGVGFPHL